jgi:hypothetical protein
MSRECDVEGCDRRRTMHHHICPAHRWRLNNHGDVLADVPIGQLRERRTDAVAEYWQQMLAAAYEPTPAEGHGRLWLV